MGLVWLGLDQWLAFRRGLTGAARFGFAPELAAALGAAASVTEMTGSRTILRLSGPRVRDALAKIAHAAAKAQLGPIEEHANLILVAAGEAMRVRFTSPEWFGADRGDGVVTPFWALSDSERAIVGAGIATAAAMLTDAPWRVVMLDGLERLDRERLPRMLAAFGRLVSEGRLDNVIGALVGDPIEVAGVTWHAVGAA
jgi:hypothetical protein